VVSNQLQKDNNNLQLYKKIDKKEGGGGEERGEDKSSHNRANSKRSASEKEQ